MDPKVPLSMRFRFGSMCRHRLSYGTFWHLLLLCAVAASVREFCRHEYTESRF